MRGDPSGLAQPTPTPALPSRGEGGKPGPKDSACSRVDVLCAAHSRRLYLCDSREAEGEPMPRTTANPLLSEVRHLIGAGGRDDVPDGQLLDRFVRDRDETAFEVLVRRYGRLVFGV